MAEIKYLDLTGLIKYTDELKNSFKIEVKRGAVGISLANKTVSIPVVSEGAAGLMTPAQKTKLDSLDLSGLVFKGGWEGNTNNFPENAEVGDFYVVTTGGATVNGVKVVAGDSIIKGENDDEWYAIQSNVDVASASTLGLVKGSTTGAVSIDADGTLDVKVASNGGIQKNTDGSLYVVFEDAAVENAAHAQTAGHAETANNANHATSAAKLDGSAGSTTQPVYFNNGVPVAITHTIEKSVPANAEFTDTKFETISIYHMPTTKTDYKSADEIDVFVGTSKSGTSDDGKSVTITLETYKMPTKTYVDGRFNNLDTYVALNDNDIEGIFKAE